MSLATSNHMEQQATHEATRCAEYFAREVLDTIDDMETLGTLLDTMEFFHSISSSTQFYTILQILLEALYIPMPDLHYYFKDSLLWTFTTD